MAGRRQSEQRVELFPFLAVLVCAMGALILLLLVMTRRIRQQAELRAEHDQRVAAAAAVTPRPAPLVLAIAPPKPKPAPRPSPPPITRRPVLAPPPVYVDPTYDQRLAARQREHQQAVAELERQWQTRVDQLAAERTALEAELQQLQQTLRDRQAEWQGLQEQASTIAEKSEWDGAVDQRLQADLANLERRRASVRQEIETLGRRLQAAQTHRAAAASQQFTIIPIDANSGTTRRPIVLECDRDRILLVSEGITLTAADLNGFIPHYNPLSAGVRTLVDGWSVTDQGKAPYVLLVVRPEGTVSFYAARMFLQPLNIPFGYELVGQDQQFVWPQTEARLVRECRRSIDEVLRDRGRVSQLAKASGRSDEPLHVLSHDGTFRLDEVDRMRQPGRSVQFAGMQIDREQHTGTTTGTAPTDERRGLNIFRRSANAAGSLETRQPAPAAASVEHPEIAAAAASDQDGGPPSSPTPSGGWTQAPGFGRGQKVTDPHAWRPPRGTGISIQRDVPVEISATRVRVAGGEPIPLPAPADATVLAQHIAQGLEDQLTAWGDPPRGYYWNPRLKLIVSPDGAVLSGQLTPLIETWGLESTLDYASKFSRIAETP
jgi:hypothetical protein